MYRALGLQSFGVQSFRALEPRLQNFKALKLQNFGASEFLKSKALEIQSFRAPQLWSFDPWSFRTSAT